MRNSFRDQLRCSGEQRVALSAARSLLMAIRPFHALESSLSEVPNIATAIFHALLAENYLSTRKWH